MRRQDEAATVRDGQGREFVCVEVEQALHSRHAVVVRGCASGDDGVFGVAEDLDVAIEGVTRRKLAAVPRERCGLVRGADVRGVAGEASGAVVRERGDEHDRQQRRGAGGGEGRRAEGAYRVGCAEARGGTRQARAGRTLALLREGVGTLILHIAASIVGASTQRFERGYP